MKGGTGTWTRVGIGLQVLVSVLLAGAAAVLLTWLSVRPGLWGRVDLTEDSRQTLDESLSTLIESLPRTVTAEVFFRQLDAPLREVGIEAQQRMLELLIVARNQLPEKLRVIEHNLGDLASVSARMQELNLDEVNVVVLHDGERQVVLRLFRDLARIDPGNPGMRIPPSLEAFLGDQALGDAILQIGIEHSPKIYFTEGQGERSLYGTEIFQLGSLHSALLSDGFELALWNPGESPEVPADCDVLAVIDPRQPFGAEALESMHRFAARGGRLLITPSKQRAALDGPGSMAVFLREYGIEVQAGFICKPLVNSLGQVTYGDPRCGFYMIGPEGLDRRHPVTASLWSVERQVLMSSARAFKRGIAPENGRLLDVVRSAANSWQDLPAADGSSDWRWNQRLEAGGSFTLVLAAEFQPTEAPGPGQLTAPVLEQLGSQEERRTRILALGSPDAFGNGDPGGVAPIDVNRDLALNAFNWLASRDHRITIRPRKYESRVLDLGKSQGLLNWVTMLLLPGLSLLMGALVWWRRRR